MIDLCSYTAEKKASSLNRVLGLSLSVVVVSMNNKAARYTGHSRKTFNVCECGIPYCIPQRLWS